MELDKIKKNYKSFSDDRIIKIAKKDVKILKPEIVEILKDEIKLRNLPSDLLKKVNATADKVKKRFAKTEFHGYLGAKIVQLNEDNLEIMLHSGYSGLIVIIRLLTNSMRKWKINYSDINLIYKGSGTLDDNGYNLIGINSDGTKTEKLTLLHLLSEKERSLLFQILERKNIKIRL